MNIVLEFDNWVINDEYFITETIKGYAVYNCGTNEEESQELYEDENFECCLTWVWNSL